MEERKHVRDGETEIDLIALCLYVLRRWRSMLIVFLAAAVIGVGVSVVKNLASLKDSIASQKMQTDYRIESILYETSVNSYENVLNTLTERLDYLKTYGEKSVLGKIDPSNVWSGTADVFLSVDSGSQNSPSLIYDPTDSLVRAYANNLSSCDYLQDFAEHLQTTPDYIREMVRISADYNSNSVNVTVLAPDQNTAQTMLDRILTQVDDLYSDMSSTFGAHTVTPINEAVFLSHDKNALIPDFDSERQTLMKELTEINTALGKLQEPELPITMDRMVFFKSGFKSGLIGGLAGLFLLCCVYAFIFIMDNHVRSAADIKSRYGIRILGTVTPPSGAVGRMSRLDAWLDRLEGRCQTEPQSVYAHIAAAVHNCAVGKHSLLLTGTSDAAQLKQSCQALTALLPEMGLTFGGSMSKDADVLRSLTDFDGVILVESIGISRYTDIEEELEYISDAKTPLLGIILL